MTISDIVLEYLKSNGYDGLMKEDCGCTINDYMPCGGEYIDDCETAYAVDVPEGIDSDGDIVLVKTKKEAEEKEKYYKEILEDMEAK